MSSEQKNISNTKNGSTIRQTELVDRFSRMNLFVETPVEGEDGGMSAPAHQERMSQLEMTTDEYEEYLVQCSYYKDKFQKKKNDEARQSRKCSKKRRNSNKRGIRNRKKSVLKTLPHSVSSIATDRIRSMLDSLLTNATSGVKDKLVSEIEGAILLYVSLTNSLNLLSVFSSISMYIKMHMNDASLFSLIEPYLKELLSTDDREVYPQAVAEPQMEDEAIQDVPNIDEPERKFRWRDRPQWLKDLASSRDSWVEVRNSLFTEKISKLLGLLVVTGLVEEDSVKLDLAGFNVIGPDLNVVHKRASSFIDAVFDTVIYFVEVGYACIKEKSIRPLITGAEETDLDEKVRQLNEWWPLVAHGNFKKKLGKEDRDFAELLDECLLETNLKRKSAVDSFSKTAMNRLFNKLCEMKNLYDDVKLSSGNRRAPFAVKFYGGTAQSKTFIQEQFIKCALASRGLAFHDGVMYNLNLQEEFWSGFTSDKLVIKIDDAMNATAETQKKNPTDALVHATNNEKYSPPMAELDAKGRRFLEALILSATTNSYWLQVKKWTICPASILRRFKFKIIVKTRPEFSLTGKAGGPLDEAKALLWKRRNPDAVVDDIWLCTVLVYTVTEDVTALPGEAIVKWRGKLLRDVSGPECIEFLVDQFNKYQDRQEELMANKQQNEENIKLCGVAGCRQVHGVCSLHGAQIGSQKETRDIETETTDPHLQKDFELVPLNEKLAADTDVDYDNDYEGERFYDEEAAAKIKSSTEKRRAQITRAKRLKKFSPKAQDFVPNSLVGVAASKLTQHCLKSVASTMNITDQVASTVLYRKGKEFWDNQGWLALLPTELVRQPWFISIMFAASPRKLAKSYTKHTFKNWAGMALIAYALSLLTDFTFRGTLYTLCWPALIRQMYMVRIVKDYYMDEILKRNVVTCMDTQTRDYWAKRLLGGSAIVLGVYTFVKFCKEMRKTGKDLGITPEILNSCPQGNLSPTSMEEVTERNEEKNVWAKVSVKPLPSSAKAKTMTYDQLRSVLAKNLYHITMDDPILDKKVDGLFLATNLLLVPDHFMFDDNKVVPMKKSGSTITPPIIVYRDVMRCKFSSSQPDATGGKFHYNLSLSASVKLEGTDMRLFYIGAGGSQRDIRHLFVDSSLPSDTQFHAGLLYRDENGKLKDHKILAKTCDTGHVFATYKGGSYRIPTKNGMCGSPIISNSATRSVVGIHLGGIEAEEYGNFGELHKGMIDRAVKELEAVPGVLLSGNDSDFVNKIMGIDIHTSAVQPEPSSPMNYLPDGSQIVYYGQCIGKTTPRSDVRDTPICEHVKEVFGIDNPYGKPAIKPAWKPYQTAMANLSIPGGSFPHTPLIWAINDYTKPIYPLFEKGGMWHDIKPLTHLETINGQNGIKFLNAMDKSTSMGLPLSKPKRDFLEIIDGEKFDFTPEVLEEITRCGDLYKQGFRAFPVSKAFTKDEVLKTSKGKCRVVYGNPISLVYWVRRYFLPIACVYMYHPIDTECAVGVNAHGPEWEQLDKAIRKFPHLFGGDYSKYDQKIPSQLINAALWIFIECAKKAGYSDEDITIMKAIAADLVYPVVAYNGDLVQLTTGAMISGNSLTVLLNSIEGSLNMRLAFHDIISEERRVPFRDAVSLVTYGDDNVGSVNSKYTDFNIKSISAFLAKYGQTYTMPDKTSEMTEFMEKVDFLQRETNYIKEIDCSIGALHDASIEKSLLCHTYGKKEALSREEKACAAVESAMLEWFNHGREKYEERREMMREVMRRAELLEYCPFLDVDFDQRVQDWKEKYGERMLTNFS